MASNDEPDTLSRMVTRSFATLVLVLASATLLRSQARPPDTDALLRELRAFDAALLQAEQNQDAEAMARLIAPQFTWVTYQGVLHDRRERIGAVAGGRRAPSTPEVLSETARWVTPDVAVLVATHRQVLGRDAERRARDVRSTRVYHRNGASWVLVAQHATEVQPQ
jgi:uncharacterized protein (TIGR02246 family)